jgi:hypothetical protein
MITVAKVIDGKVISSGSLVDLYPSFTFPPSGPSKQWLAENDLVKVIDHMEYDHKTFKLVRVDPFLNEVANQWYNFRLEELGYDEKTNAKETQWSSIRARREHIMNRMQWRFTRYDREVRLGIEPTTDDIVKLDGYMDALANITDQDDPFNITWPTPV